MTKELCGIEIKSADDGSKDLTTNKFTYSRCIKGTGFCMRRHRFGQNAHP